MMDLADTGPAQPGRAVRFPGVPAIVDGSEAIAHVETRISEVAKLDGSTASQRAVLALARAASRPRTRRMGTWKEAIN